MKTGVSCCGEGSILRHSTERLLIRLRKIMRKPVDRLSVSKFIEL